MDILFIVAIAGFILLWFFSERNRDRTRNRILNRHDSSHHWFHDSGKHDGFISDNFTDARCNDSGFDSGGCDTDF